jgi:lysophospholipase L1-like esterase
MSIAFKSGMKLLFTGDSITDCGRRDAGGKPWGNGYVKMFADMLAVRDSEKQFDIINTGCGGHTVEGCLDRWSDDVLVYKPDFISFKIGINDCNQHLSNPAERQRQSAENYAKDYRTVLEETKKHLPDAELLLIAPFYASQNSIDGTYRSKVIDALPAYIQTVRDLSKEFGTKLLETQPLFDQVLKGQPAKRFFDQEPVHPSSAGHLLMAEAVYKTLSA